MAIAELGRLRVGLFQRVAERTTIKPAEDKIPLKPISQFTRGDTLVLARAYTNNLWHSIRLGDSSHVDLERAMLSGTTEVQKMSLEMLGQYHIAGIDSKRIHVGKADKLGDGDLTAEIRDLSEKDVRKLVDLYKESKSFAVQHKLADREFAQITVDEMKVYSRMLQAGRILDTLGQRDLVIAINNSFIPPHERVNWAANRSTGHGDLM